MIRRQILPAKLLLLGGVILNAACGENTAITRIKLAHGLDTGHPVHQAMEFMAQNLAQTSGGEMRIDIYPNQQLGTERQTLELLQIGSVGMTKVSAAVLENFAPNLKVVSLPYIFRDRAHFFRVLDGEVGKTLLQESEPFWLRGLTYYDAGSRSFYSTAKPIITPADLAGLKIRVQPSATAMKLIRKLGGSPTPIAWGELYTSLQQGVVDGAENNPPSFYLSRHYEVAKYYSINEHTSVPDILVISTHVWHKLSKRQQAWLQAAADKSALRQRQLWARAEEEALAAVVEAGVEVFYPDKALFANKVKTMFDDYREDPHVYRYIERILAARLDQ